MLEKIIALRNGENSVKEFLSAIRQGIPSAVFGVSDAFKNYLVSVIDEPVLYIVKDGLSAADAERAVKEFTGKKTVILPAKEETLISTRAFSKDGLYKRIRASRDLPKADVIITTVSEKGGKSYAVARADGTAGRRSFFFDAYGLRTRGKR